MSKFSLELFSDFHKDVYGFRPNMHHPFYTMSDAERQAEWEYMQVTLRSNEERSRKEEQIAIELFERNIPHGKRDDYIADLIENEGLGDPDFACFLRNLPYGYLTKK
jgi:hypothetical protein